MPAPVAPRPDEPPDRERIVSEMLAGVFRGELDPAGAIDLIVASARRALGADRASCYVHGEDGRRVLAVHTTEGDPRVRAVIEGARDLTADGLPVWRLLARRADATLVVEDLGAEREIPAATARALGAGAFIGMRLEHPSVPGEARPSVLGTLFVSFRRPRRFSAREHTTAQSLAGMAAVALANARLRAAVQRGHAQAGDGATTDPLTGLANHRAFQERLGQEVTRARRHGRSLSLALVDIDRFRRVNETHGHRTGDRVLVEVTRRLREQARASDVLGRVGGEEIAWLMPETGAMEAWQAVDRARQAISGTPLERVGAVTVSAGVCDLERAGSAPELARLAEGALYWAKQHGRDVAFLYSPAVVEELSAQDRAERLHRLQALQSIRVLARAVDAKDPLTLEHSERVADVAVAIAAAMGWGSERLARLREAGLVHDVGKIGIRDRILFKPGRLTPAEYGEIVRHAEIGAEMLGDVLTPEQVAWVRGHHERWDGTGYPDRLAGRAIPDGARVLTLADAWDVMTSGRSYHEPLTAEEALAECERCAGAQFWGDAVGVLVRLVRSGAAEVAWPRASQAATDVSLSPSIRRPRRYPA